MEGRKIFKVSLNHELSPVFSGNEWPLFFSPRCGNIVADVLDLRVSGKHLTFPPLLPSSFSLLYVEEKKFEVPCKPCARNALKDYLKLGYEIFIEEIFSSFFFFFFLINLRRNHRKIGGFFFFHKFKTSKQRNAR